MPEHQQIQQSKKPDTIFQKKATPANQTPVSNPYSIIQRAKINPKSLTHADIMQLQRTIGNRAVGRLLSGIGNSSTTQQATVQRQEIPEEEEPLQGKMAETVQLQEIPEEEEPLQGKFEIIQRQEIPEEEEPLQGKFEEKPEIACPPCFVAPIVQRQEIPEEEEPLQGKMIGTIQRQEIPEEEEPLQTKRENNTGMPDNLKAGVENLSGIDMSDVRVHYNSSKPAEVGALAYTQGTDIHVASGQERHLPHEAWHVVQQAQGRVKPMMQLKGMFVNDDAGLEKEADFVGAKIARTHKKISAPTQRRCAFTTSPTHRDDLQGNIIQCASLRTLGGIWKTVRYELPESNKYGVIDADKINGVRMELEFIPKSPTDAEVIGLSQAVKTEQKKGGSPPNNPFYTEGINPFNKRGSEYQIDQKIDNYKKKNSPLYAGGSSLIMDNLYNEPAEADLGQHGKRVQQNNGDWISENARLEDTPCLWKYVNNDERNGRYEKESQLFETTAIAVKGNQIGTYYGSVSWGWSADSKGNMTINPLAVSSNGVPSEAFMMAADAWNRNNALRPLPRPKR